MGDRFDTHCSAQVTSGPSVIETGQTVRSTKADKKAVEGMYVVETHDGQAFLGRVEYVDDDVVVYTGYVGRPPVIPRDEVASLVPAAGHPDVVVELAS